MDSDRAIREAQAQARRRYKRGALAAFAACLLVVAALSAVELVWHIQQDHTQGTRLWPSDDHFESALVLAWFASGVLALVVGHSLRSPVRQFIFACAGMMTGLAMLFCLIAIAG